MVRNGKDIFLPVHRNDPPHTVEVVYREMLLQICRDYPAIRDFRCLGFADIRFFYEGLRAELREGTKPAESK